MTTSGNYDRPQPAPLTLPSEWAGEVNTDANGIATFNFGSTFTSEPIAVASLVAAANVGLNYLVQLLTVTQTGATVLVTVGGEVNIVGIGAMGPPSPVAGVSVQLLARARTI